MMRRKILDLITNALLTSCLREPERTLEQHSDGYNHLRRVEKFMGSMAIIFFIMSSVLLLLVLLMTEINLQNLFVHIGPALMLCLFLFIVGLYCRAIGIIAQRLLTRRLDVLDA